MAGFAFGGRKTGGWAKVGVRLSRATKQVKKSQALAVKRAALLVERELKKGIRSGRPGGKRFKRLSPFTRLARRGSKPLLDTGALLGSIKTTFVASSASAFVGVHRSARSSTGESVVNIAVVHEFGTKPFVIRVTDKVRSFFLAMHFLSGGKISPLSSATTTIAHPGVPARPFIRPTVEKLRPRLEKLIAKVVSDEGGI